MTRVLVAAPAITPVIGGAETIAEVLTAGLIRCPDIDVDLLVGNRPTDDLCDAVNKQGTVRVIDEFGPRDLVVGWETAFFSRAEAIFTAARRVQVVHAMSHDAVVSAAIAFAGMRPPERPVLIATLSEISTQTTDFGAARSRFVYSLPVDGWVHLSRYYQNVARSHGSRPRIERVCAGVDDARFRWGDRTVGRSMIGARPHDFVIACPSRFTPRKGQLDLLDAIDTLHPRLRHRVVTVLAGSANSGSREFEDRLRERATNTDARVVVQRVDRSRMPDLFAGADVVALPSHFEGLGFAAIEAMIACRPVLMTKVCGFDEVISNESEALLVPPRDPVALGAAIEQLLVDEPRRERLAQAGHQRALSVFTASKFLEDVVCVYEECLQNAGTLPR